MDRLQLTIHEINAQIIALAQLEAQFHAAVLKRDVVEDRNPVIRLCMLRDVHHTVDQIDLLVSFGAPAAVAGPAIADVLLARCLLLTGEVIGEEQCRFRCGKRGTEHEKEEKACSFGHLSSTAAPGLLFQIPHGQPSSRPTRYSPASFA